jgi:hypothetical protein
MNDDHVLCRLITRPGYRNTEGKFLAACLDDALLPRHPRHLLRQSRIVCCHARAVARNLDVTLGGCVSRKRRKSNDAEIYDMQLPSGTGGTLRA